MFGSDPIGEYPFADTPDPSIWRQGAIVAFVNTVPSETATSTTLPAINATVTTHPGK